ncbi:MAG TPA: hypothetical protein VN786_07875 [Acidimicrobiales bacterium]|nr:hypothetical protein [Acidimicrobiales bacterium]
MAPADGNYDLIEEDFVRLLDDNFSPREPELPYETCGRSTASAPSTDPRPQLWQRGLPGRRGRRELVRLAAGSAEDIPPER